MKANFLYYSATGFSFRYRNCKPGLYLICFLLLSSLVGFSQDSYIKDSVRLEEITISALNSYKNMQAGTSIFVLDSMAIADKISGNLADLLAQNSTVYIKSAGGGSVATASMRGTGASHTSLIWNDMPINSPMTGQADFSLIPVYFIDEANVLLGAASLLHVGGALGGGVAVENKPDWNSGMKVKTIQGVGSFNSYTGFSQLGWSGDKVSVRVRGFYEASENNFKYYNSAPNVDAVGYYRQKNAGYAKGGLLTETYFRINEHALFSLKYWFQNRDANIPKLLSSSPKEHNEKQSDLNQRIVTSWKNYSEKWQWETMLGYANDKTGYFLQNINSGSSSAVTNFDTDNLTHLLFSQIQTQYDIKDQLKINLQVSDNYSIAQSTDHVHFQDYRADQNEFSFLGSAYKNIGKQWIFSFLLRQHLIDNEFIKPIPSAGAEYSILNHILSFRLNISRNYHHPSLNDLYYQPGGNKNLRPEEGTTGEFGISAIVKMLRVDVNSYYSIINDWILWEPSQFGYWTPKNVQTVHSRGIESHINWKKEAGHFHLALDAKYAFTLTTNQSTNLAEGDDRKGKQLIYIPQNSANGMITCSYRNYDFSWISCYVGQRQTNTSNDNLSQPLNGYSVHNISTGIYFNWSNYRVDVHGRIDNLFNVNYMNVIDRPMPGRYYTLLVKFSL